MSVSSKQIMGLVTTETISTQLDKGDQTEDVTHNLNTGALSTSTLASGTTVPATKVYQDEISLIAGTATIDLTDLLGAFGAAVDFSGLKVQQVYIKADSANANTMEFAEAVANGYFLFGTTGDQITLAAGDEAMLRFGDWLPDVAAGAKDILVTGTGTEKFTIHLVAG